MPHTPPDILCIGSVLWDIIGRAHMHMAPGADVPGRITRRPGGVAMNIAMTLARFGLRPALLSAVGRDEEGEELVAVAQRMGLDCSHVYLAIENANGLVAAVADAYSLEAAGERILKPLGDGRLGSFDAPWAGPVALDGNLTEALLAQIAHSPLFALADLRVAPASPGKAERLLPLLRRPRTTLYLNLEEAGILCQDRFEDAPAAAAALIERGAHRVLVTDGPRAAACGAADGVLHQAPPPVLQTRVTGAGDTFMAAHWVAERRGAGREAALAAALQAAARHVSGELPA